jgi:hypothetical protein
MPFSRSRQGRVQHALRGLNGDGRGVGYVDLIWFSVCMRESHESRCFGWRWFGSFTPPFPWIHA